MHIDLCKGWSWKLFLWDKHMHGNECVCVRTHTHVYTNTLTYKTHTNVYKHTHIYTNTDLHISICIYICRYIPDKCWHTETRINAVNRNYCHNIQCVASVIYRGLNIYFCRFNYLWTFSTFPSDFLLFPLFVFRSHWYNWSYSSKWKNTYPKWMEL